MKLLSLYFKLPTISKNYLRYYYDGLRKRWIAITPPLSLFEAQRDYLKDTISGDPLEFGLSNPKWVRDTLFYFVRQDWNVSDLSENSDQPGIFKPQRYRYNFLADGSIQTDQFGDTVFTSYPHTLNIDSAFLEDTFRIDSVSQDTTWYRGGELTEDG